MGEEDKCNERLDATALSDICFSYLGEWEGWESYLHQGDCQGILTVMSSSHMLGQKSVSVMLKVLGYNIVSLLFTSVCLLKTI